ncbi:MAG: hypothetical protein ACFFC0_02330 [Promethearchaeota archaeon]
MKPNPDFLREAIGQEDWGKIRIHIKDCFVTNHETVHETLEILKTRVSPEWAPPEWYPAELAWQVRDTLDIQVLYAVVDVLAEIASPQSIDLMGMILRGPEEFLSDWHDLETYDGLQFYVLQTLDQIDDVLVAEQAAWFLSEIDIHFADTSQYPSSSTWEAWNLAIEIALKHRFLRLEVVLTRYMEYLIPEETLWPYVNGGTGIFAAKCLAELKGVEAIDELVLYLAKHSWEPDGRDPRIAEIILGMGKEAIPKLRKHLDGPNGTIVANLLKEIGRKR